MLWCYRDLKPDQPVCLKDVWATIEDRPIHIVAASSGENVIELLAPQFSPHDFVGRPEQLVISVYGKEQSVGLSTRIVDVGEAVEALNNSGLDGVVAHVEKGSICLASTMPPFKYHSSQNNENPFTITVLRKMGGIQAIVQPLLGRGLIASIDGVVSTQTVLDLKKRIHEKCGVRPENQALFVGNLQLQDDIKITEYGTVDFANGPQTVALYETCGCTVAISSKSSGDCAKALFGKSDIDLATQDGQFVGGSFSPHNFARGPEQLVIYVDGKEQRVSLSTNILDVAGAADALNDAGLDGLVARVDNDCIRLVPLSADMLNHNLSTRAESLVKLDLEIEISLGKYFLSTRYTGASAVDAEVVLTAGHVTINSGSFSSARVRATSRLMRSPKSPESLPSPASGSSKPGSPPALSLQNPQKRGWAAARATPASPDRSRQWTLGQSRFDAWQ